MRRSWLAFLMLAVGAQLVRKVLEVSFGDLRVELKSGTNIDLGTLVYSFLSLMTLVGVLGAGLTFSKGSAVPVSQAAGLFRKPFFLLTAAFALSPLICFVPLAIASLFYPGVRLDEGGAGPMLFLGYDLSPVLYLCAVLVSWGWVVTLPISSVLLAFGVAMRIAAGLPLK